MYSVKSYTTFYIQQNEVVLELKAVDGIHRIYEAQLLTYLRAMDKRVGLLINFNAYLLYS